MNLELASTDDLLDEVFQRFDHAVFAGMKVRPDGKPESPDGQIYEKKKSRGNTRTCQGLCFALMLFKQADFDENAQVAEDDSPL